MRIWARRRLRLQRRQIWPPPHQLSSGVLLPPPDPVCYDMGGWFRWVGADGGVPGPGETPSQPCWRDGGDARGRRSPPWRRRSGPVLPIPCPLASWVKTQTLLDGGDAPGAVIFLKTPFLGTSGAAGFGVVRFGVRRRRQQVSSGSHAFPGAGFCYGGALRAALRASGAVDLQEGRG